MIHVLEDESLQCRELRSGLYSPHGNDLHRTFVGFYFDNQEGLLAPGIGVKLNLIKDNDLYHPPKTARVRPKQNDKIRIKK